MADKERRKSSVSLFRAVSKVSRRISVTLRSTKPDNHVYANTYLPVELVQQILLNLKQLHNCRTCYTRDLASVVRINRTFYHALLGELYANIKLHTDASRLGLLLRTLKQSSTVATLVRRLTLTTTTKDGYDTIAAIIRLCSRLQSYRGIYEYFPQPINGNPARAIGEALYSRTSLKEHSWWSNEEQTAFQWFGFKIDDWVNYHANWVQLETLALRGWRTVRILNKPVTVLEFERVFSLLPNLKRVALSKFESDEVDNDCLLALPQLEGLRLESLPGITMAGISRYIMRANSLTSLTLIELPNVLIGAEEVSNLVSSLPRLERLIIRSSTPFQLAYVPPHLEELGSMDHQPVLSSHTLRYIHWHIIPPVPSNAWLRHAILNGYLPRLRRLQVPEDKDGALRAICRTKPHDVESLRQRAAAERPYAIYRAEIDTEVDDTVHNLTKRNLQPPLQVPLNIFYDLNPLHPHLATFLLLDNSLEALSEGSFRPLAEHHTYKSTSYSNADFEYMKWEQTDFGGIEGIKHGCTPEWGPRKCDGSWKLESEEMQARDWMDKERRRAAWEDGLKRRRKGDWWHEPQVVDLWDDERGLLDLF